LGESAISRNSAQRARFLPELARTTSRLRSLRLHCCPGNSVGNSVGASNRAGSHQSSAARGRGAPWPGVTAARRARAQIHWFSIINSCVTVLLLTGFLATILMRVLKNDFVRFGSDEEAGARRPLPFSSRRAYLYSIGLPARLCATGCRV